MPAKMHAWSFCFVTASARQSCVSRDGVYKILNLLDNAARPACDSWQEWTLPQVYTLCQVKTLSYEVSSQLSVKTSECVYTFLGIGQPSYDHWSTGFVPRFRYRLGAYVMIYKWQINTISVITAVMSLCISSYLPSGCLREAACIYALSFVKPPNTCVLLISMCIDKIYGLWFTQLSLQHNFITSCFD